MPASPDLLCLQSNRFPVKENPLALVGFWFPPLPNLCRKFSDDLLINALEENTSGLWSARFYALWDPQFDGMRKSDFQVDELLTGVCGFHCSCFGLDAGPVTDTNQT